MRNLRRFLPSVAATAIVAGALAVPSLAQDAGGDTPSTQESTDHADGGERSARREAARARFDELLAEELGITVDELTEARDAVKEQLRAEFREELVARLDAKVAAGELTQQEADEILARFDAGERPFADRRGRHGRRGPGHGRGPGGPGYPGADGGDASGGDDAAPSGTAA